MPARRKPTEAEMLALREEMQRLFPCKSWEADPAGADGSVDFRCDCGAASARYPSQTEGELALGEHLDAIDADRRKYFTDWGHQHVPDAMTFFRYPEPEQRRSDHIADRVRRRSTPRPRAQFDDFPRHGGPRRQSEPNQQGLARVVLSRQGLVGALNVPMAVLAERLGLRVERSFGDSYDCDIAYLETDEDAFTLVDWEEAEHVEVHALVEPIGPNHRGVPELERFLEHAGLTWDDVHFPSRVWAIDSP